MNVAYHGSAGELMIKVVQVLATSTVRSPESQSPLWPCRITHERSIIQVKQPPLETVLGWVAGIVKFARVGENQNDGKCQILPVTSAIRAF